LRLSYLCALARYVADVPRDSIYAGRHARYGNIIYSAICGTILISFHQKGDCHVRAILFEAANH